MMANGLWADGLPRVPKWEIRVLGPWAQAMGFVRGWELYCYKKEIDSDDITRNKAHEGWEREELHGMYTKRAKLGLASSSKVFRSTFLLPYSSNDSRLHKRRVAFPFPKTLDSMATLRRPNKGEISWTSLLKYSHLTPKHGIPNMPFHNHGWCTQASTSTGNCYYALIFIFLKPSLFRSLLSLQWFWPSSQSRFWVPEASL